MRDYRQLIVELFGQPGEGDNILVMAPDTAAGFRDAKFFNGVWTGFDALGLVPGMEVLYNFGPSHPGGLTGNRQFVIPPDAATQVEVVTTGGPAGSAAPVQTLTVKQAGLGLAGIALLGLLVWYLYKHHGKR